jgi:putative endonuclease
VTERNEDAEGCLRRLKVAKAAEAPEAPKAPLKAILKPEIMGKGYMYILECADGSYYTGSTRDLDKRLAEHQAGTGAKYTKARLPVKLVYYEEFDRIDEAFYREKQVQGWDRKKKEALIKREYDNLPNLSIAYRDKKNLKNR